MSQATRDFVNSTVGGFATGYKIGEAIRKRQGEEEVGDWAYTDYVKQVEQPGAADAGAIPESAPVGAEGNVVMSSVSEPNAIAEPEQEDAPFGEGGDPEKVNALINAGATEEAIDTTESTGNIIDDAMARQKNIPKVTVFDWEAAKAAKAKAYAKAGMMDKVANIDAEFDQLKQQNFQKYAVRAMQEMDRNPAKAAEYLSMASQYHADGTQSLYMPSPDGKFVMEYEIDEVTQKPRGQGEPVDAEKLRSFIQMNADPSKFLYTQYDRQYRRERDKEADKQWKATYDQRVQQHQDTMDLGYKKQYVDMLIAEQRNATAVQTAALRNGDVTAEDIGKKKAEITNILMDPEKNVALQGIPGIASMTEEGRIDLATLASDVATVNDQSLGAAQSIGAAYHIMEGEVKAGEVQKAEDGSSYFIDPKTNVKTKLPESLISIYNYRLRQAAKTE